jgi:hypothetical protein
MNRKPALFNGFWFDADGQKLRRVTRAEMRTAWRLWVRHADVRTGRVRA